ncbi:MAG: bifunctional riboflavin kinase/FAD synthetase, partial [Chloroflexota bacterium]
AGTALAGTALAGTALAGTALSIGSFDGVHRGHQAIVRRMVKEAHAGGLLAAVLTFHPHPSVVLRGRSGPLYLTTPEERAALLGELGVDLMVIEPFTRDLAGLTALEFMTRLVERLRLRRLYAGHDFALGRNREGDLARLQQLGGELGYTVSQAQPVQTAGQIVSSSRIRAALAEGDVRLARRLLGRPYRAAGPVVTGDQRGRTIGIPTANLEIEPDRLLPSVGVYAGIACVDGDSYQSVTNIGLRPTFTGGVALPRVETHLMDYSGDLYGKTIQLAFLARLRDEMKFDGVEALLAQIRADIRRARRLIKI